MFDTESSANDILFKMHRKSRARSIRYAVALIVILLLGLIVCIFEVSTGIDTVIPYVLLVCALFVFGAAFEAINQMGNIRADLYQVALDQLDPIIAGTTKAEGQSS